MPVIVPAVAVADTGNTNTIKMLPATTTISPVGIGGSFSVNIVANGAVDISGAGAGLTFDKTKLTLTAMAKDPTEVANGPAYAGFPNVANMATFIGDANTVGEIPAIAWSYTDGSSFELANQDHGIFSATFSVTAIGDSSLGVVIGSTGGLLDGTPANYGAPLTVITTGGTVVNSLAPTAAIGTLVSWSLASAITLGWSGTAGSNPIASYDIRYRRAPSFGTFGAYVAWLTATASTSGSFALSPGYTWCLSVRATDNQGHPGAWSAEKCVGSPLDDRSLTRSRGWLLKTSSSFYRGTAVLTSSLGAKLTRLGARAKIVTLVATTCSTCGNVTVTFGTSSRSISLRSTTTVNRRVFTVFSFTSVRAGTLTIKVTTSRKKVLIDGVGLRVR
jgi:hypothetical protein